MKEADNSIEQFMTTFNKMFSQTKYNLQSLNKRVESMEKCFNNILLLKSNKPFDEGEEEKQEKYSSQDEKSENLKISSKELDEIERIFREFENPRKAKSNCLKKKMNSKKYHGKRETVKKKKINRNKNEDDNSMIIDCLEPDIKIEKYTKFKEMKNKILNKGKNDQISEDEFDDDDLDFDME